MVVEILKDAYVVEFIKGVKIHIPKIAIDTELCVGNYITMDKGKFIKL